ncbi:MAG: transposase, partial [Candidatus Saccharimonadales bacterium]
MDEGDYAVFLNLLKRYLDDRPARDSSGRPYDWLHDDLDLAAFCLMPNHFHLLIYQTKSEAMTRLLRGVATSYTTYFNKKHNRIGPLFQDRFKASMILRDDYLQHISRYIHLNPKNYKSWEFSSLPYYLGVKQA